MVFGSRNNRASEEEQRGRSREPVPLMESKVSSISYICSQNSKSGLDPSTNRNLSSNVPTHTQANSLPPPQSLRLLPQPRRHALGSSPHHNPPTSTFTPTVEGTQASSYLVAHPWLTSLEPCWARIDFQHEHKR
jgi:hypothetical protein